MGQVRLEPESIFQGGYQVIRELGEGASGRVYEARQISTRQLVAVKILRQERGANEERVRRQRERFRREMQLCAELSHPNIVRLIDSGESREGILYAVFEHVAGDTLEEILAREGPLEFRESVHLMGQVLDALACAHRRGIVHRDLKPANVMITQTGARRNALVLDFGLGGLVEELRGGGIERITRDREAMGTLAYAAPEQLWGEPTTTRSDLYSWGLVFAECLTGEPVLRGSAAEIMQLHLEREPIRLPDWLESHALGRVLRMVTARELEKRDVSALELLELLDQISQDDARLPAQERASRIGLSGEQRALTLVSCRLLLSARGAQPLGVEREEELLRALRDRVAEVAGRRGGHIATFLGDRLLLQFGYPRAREDDVARALAAASDVVAVIGDEDRRLRAEGLALEVRIGVHTGVVILRERRGTPRGAFELVGATPRLASELATLAGPGEVLASDETRRLLGADERFSLHGRFSFPGEPGPLPVYRLAAAQAAAPFRTGAERAPLVGRSEELAQLVAAWDRAAQGAPQALLLSGEAGIGKSRLVHELRLRVQARWLECHCVSEGEASPLLPVLERLRLAEEPLEALIERHATALTAQGADPHEMTAVLRAALDGASAVPEVLRSITRERRQDVTISALVELLFAMARSEPLVFVVEDVHWADPTTLDFLGRLVREIRASAEIGAGARLVALCTARPDFGASWAATEMRAVQLGRLGRQEVEDLVSALAAGRGLPGRLLEEIVSHADGIPLFVEEITRALVESRALEVGVEARFEVPSTLRSLLVARLDGLSREASRTAQEASAVGRGFPFEILRSISTRDEPALRGDLDELARAGLIFHQRNVPTESYVFKHGLLRDAAYESILLADRRKLHQGIALALRERFPATEPERLAHHWSEAGVVGEAIAGWSRAGAQASSRGAYPEAIRHFDRALATLGTQPETAERMRQEVELTELKGTALFSALGYAHPAVEATFARARELCTRLGGEVPARVLFGIWSVHLTRSEAEPLPALIEAIQALARRGDPTARLEYPAYVAIRAFYTGDFVTARRCMLEICKEYGGQDYAAAAAKYGYEGGLYWFAYLMWSEWILGNADAALAAGRELVTHAEASGNPYGIALAWAFSVNLCRDRGEPALARELADRLIAHAERQRLYFWLGPARCGRGWALARSGEIEAGIEEIRGGLALIQAVGLRTTYPYHLSALVEAQLAAARGGEALATVEEALALCDRQLDCFYRAELLRLQAEAQRLEGDRDAAARSLERALALAQQQGARAFELRAATSAARLHAEAGQPGRARGILNDAVAGFPADLETIDLRAARALLAELGA